MTALRYLSICSGIEAATVAWHPLGWEAAAFAEIDRFPSAVLSERWPGVPNLGDFTAIDTKNIGEIHVLVGGTPCQSFSLAGDRRGLAEPRGNLALSFVRLAHALAATGHLRFAIWENVPGVLSMRDNAFGSLLGGLAGADAPLHSPLERGQWPGAGMAAGPRARIAWRVLDAQYFGLAQRRERVFVVAGFGDGADPAAVLFERKSRGWHPAPGDTARQDVAGTLESRASAGGGSGTDFEIDAGLLAYGGNNSTGPLNVATALNAKGGAGRMDFESETFVTAYRTTGNDGAYETGDRTGALGTGTDPNAHVLAVSLRGREGGGTAELGGKVAPALRASQGGGDKSHALTPCGVRRLTPRECERLQGFPDDYTAITYRGKPAADGPRYRALGNSMAVPVMRWIGERIARQLDITAER